MIDDGALQEKIREAIQAGDLPNRLPDRVWGSRAATGLCAVCGEPTDGGVELELVFNDNSRAVEKSCCVHDRCLNMFERTILGLPMGANGAGSMAGTAERRHG